MFMYTIINNVEELGKQIKVARKEQGLTQEDLAGLTGTGRRFIIELEKGKETAQLGKVIDVMNSLGICLSTTQKWRK